MRVAIESLQLTRYQYSSNQMPSRRRCDRREHARRKVCTFETRQLLRCSERNSTPSSSSESCLRMVSGIRSSQVTSMKTSLTLLSPTRRRRSTATRLGALHQHHKGSQAACEYISRDPGTRRVRLQTPRIWEDHRCRQPEAGRLASLRARHGERERTLSATRGRR